MSCPVNPPAQSEPRAAAVSPDVVEGQAPAIVEGHFVENCHSSNNNKISIVVACGSCEVHNHVDVPRHTYYVVTVGTSVGIFQSAAYAESLISGVSGGGRVKVHTKAEALELFREAAMDGRVEIRERSP